MLTKPKWNAFGILGLIDVGSWNQRWRAATVLLTIEQKGVFWNMCSLGPVHGSQTRGLTSAQCSSAPHSLVVASHAESDSPVRPATFAIW